MTFFESLLVLLLAAIALLQVARHFSLPYPALLAAAGVVVALIPGAPEIEIDPHTALALFIAPALVDSAYDFPRGAARRFRGALIMLAVLAVLVTASLVAWLGWAFAGLPLAAAFALGAIVAPPDAAAAVAVLSSVSIPRTSETVLRGESLFNDATALLLFSAALAVQSGGGLDLHTGLQLTLAAPGGILFGIAVALGYRWIDGLVSGTLGGNLLQFVNAFLVWVVAERLHLSAVLAVVAFAMTISRSTGAHTSPRNRVHSFAVWTTVVFFLNVVAFLLMGMQARTIVTRMPRAELIDALGFGALICVAVIVARIAVVVAWNRFEAHLTRRRGEPEPATLKQGVLVGWSGMRGLVSLATAFALPGNFPQRDLIVLAAFMVVIATLVLQGLTLGPLIRRLGLDRTEDEAHGLIEARRALAKVALEALDGADAPEAGKLRHYYEIEKRESGAEGNDPALERYRKLGLNAIARQRDRLEDMRRNHEIGTESYFQLQEALDWRELTLLPDERRRIEEN